MRLETDDEGVYAHGYAILDLDDDRRRAAVSYYVETDTTAPIYVEELT